MGTNIDKMKEEYEERIYKLSVETVSLEKQLLVANKKIFDMTHTRIKLNTKFIDLQQEHIRFYTEYSSLQALYYKSIQEGRKK